MDRRIFLLGGILPIVVALGAIVVGLGLVVFGDNGSDTKVAVGSTAEPTTSADAADDAAYGIGWLGVGGGSTPSGKGVAITEVVDGGPADDAGISVGDLFLEFEGTDVNTIDKLARLVQQHEPGVVVTISVVEGGVANPDGEAEDVDVTLGVRPAEAAPDGEETGGGWLGVEGETSDDADSVEVTDVVNGGPADDAGIATGDIILAVDGETMESFRALSSLIRTHSPGDTVTITVEHDGDENDVEVTLGERPVRDLPDIGGLLPDIGGILDGFDVNRLIGGEFRYLDDDGNVVTISADAGEITSISTDEVTIQPPEGDDKTFDLPADSRVTDDLVEGDNAVVVSKDGEVIAVVSTDIGKLLPGLPRFKLDGDFDFGDFFPDGIGPHCTVENGTVNCEIEVKPGGGSAES
jgi:membrane-associated protease RseP (regulator of RpoE activity)